MEVKEILSELQKTKNKQKEQFSKISYHINPKKEKKTDSSDNKFPKLKPKEDIYNEMKDKFRFAWKAPGYVN
jgi:hypothetical protein